MGNFLSFLRRIVFIILVILSVTMWTKGGVLVPLGIATAVYILLLFVTWIYTKILFCKYPNRKKSFIEYLWTIDICNFFIVHCDLCDCRVCFITIVVCISYDDGKVK